MSEDRNDIELINKAIVSGIAGDFDPIQIGVLSTIFSNLEEKKMMYSIMLKDIEVLTGQKLSYLQLDKSVTALGSRHFETIEKTIYRGKEITAHISIWLFQMIRLKKKKDTIEIFISQPAYNILSTLKKNVTSTKQSDLIPKVVE